MNEGSGTATDPGCLAPDWPAPSNVRAMTTLRHGGCSRDPWRSFNLALHTGDDPEAVRRNRALLKAHFALPSEPAWLEQVHGNRLVLLDSSRADGPPPQADGSLTRTPGVVCAVMTADCLPVLLCDRAGTRVAAVHAGWKGLLNGIIGAAVDALEAPPETLLAWLGPAIGPARYEIGVDVHDAFLRRDPRYRCALRPAGSGHWLLDVYAVARMQLSNRGVEAVGGGTECTYTDTGKYYSYRRDGVCGRMASLIWIT